MYKGEREHLLPLCINRIIAGPKRRKFIEQAISC